MPKCPACDVTLNLETTPTAPFCSDRCRLIDLGRWLDEGYAVPSPRQPAEHDESAGVGDPDEA